MTIKLPVIYKTDSHYVCEAQYNNRWPVLCDDDSGASFLVAIGENKDDAIYKAQVLTNLRAGPKLNWGIIHQK